MTNQRDPIANLVLLFEMKILGSSLLWYMVRELKIFWVWVDFVAFFNTSKKESVKSSNLDLSEASSVGFLGSLGVSEKEARMGSKKRGLRRKRRANILKRSI